MLIPTTCPECSHSYSVESTPRFVPFLNSGALQMVYQFLLAGSSTSLMPPGSYLLQDLARGIQQHYDTPDWSNDIAKTLWPILNQERIHRGRKGVIIGFDPRTLPPPEEIERYKHANTTPQPPSLDDPASLVVFPYPLHGLNKRTKKPASEYDLTAALAFDPPITSVVSVEDAYYRFWPYQHSQYPPGIVTFRSFPHPAKPDSSIARAALALSIKNRETITPQDLNELSKPRPAVPRPAASLEDKRAKQRFLDDAAQIEKARDDADPNSPNAIDF